MGRHTRLFALAHGNFGTALPELLNAGIHLLP